MRVRYWMALAAAISIGLVGSTGFMEKGLSGTVAQAAEPVDEVSSMAVSMSNESGCYDKEFFLEITGEGVDKIYYTMDGSNPVTSTTRVEYTGAIPVTDRKGEPNILSAVDPVLFDNANLVYQDGIIRDEYSAPEDSEVDKATVVKAVGVDADGKYSNVVTNTYFVGVMSEHIQGIEESCKAAGIPLSIMSISMDSSDLFDYEKGIYVKGKIFDEAFLPYKDTISSWEVVDIARKLEANYSQRGLDWERAAHIDYLESDGAETVCKLQQDCGIRIQGNYSRSDLQKGFRLFARNSYGKKNFNYAFFGEELKNDEGKTMDKFKRLTLRNGGNTAFLAKYNDAYWQSLITDIACETQASRACIVYLDGEYWGIYILQENYDDSYFENTHGVSKESVVLYKGDGEKYACGYKLDEGELPEGVTDEGYYLAELKQFFESHTDLKSEADYREFEKLVDVDSVRDFFAAQIWLNNKWDFPGKNWSFWKTTQIDAANPYADGRWRLCIYDLDFGGISGISDARANTIREDGYRTYGLLDMNADKKNPVVLSFAYLMSNSGFRDSFAKRIKELDRKNFGKNSALAACRKYRDTYRPLYLQYFTRFFGADAASYYVENAITGGYGSYQCLEDFINNRSDNIQTMLNWVDDFYATHSVYNSALEEDDKGKKIKTFKVTAKKGSKTITVKTIKKAKVTVALSKKIILSGKKKVKLVTISASKNKTGTIKVKLSSKLKKGMKLTVGVIKEGYELRFKTKKIV